MTASLDGYTKENREQNLIVRIGKSEAEVTNKILRSRYCTVEANYRQTRSIAPRPQFRDVNVTQLSSFDPVTPADVSKLIHDAPNKQSWLDPLPLWLLKECSYLLSPFLTALCNTSLRNGTVPASFKTAVVTPLIKKSSMDVNTLQNYRPISNLSFVSKLLESLVSTQLQLHVDTHFLLPPNQSAYRRGHSTETALGVLRSH